MNPVGIVNIDRFIDFNPLTTAPDTLLKSAVVLMSQKQSKSNCLLIVLANKPIGILTSRDIIRLVAGQIDLTTTTVDKVMTRPVFTRLRSQLDSNFDLVRSFFQEHSVSYLPILNNDRELIGIIDSRNFILHSDSEIINTAQNAVDSCDRELARFFDLNNLQCIVGLDGYFKRVNSAFSKTLGFTYEEVLNESWINFVHPEDLTATIAKLENLSVGKTTISWENRYRSKNGSYRWLLWTAKLDLETKSIYIAAIDISDRKQSELALIESEARWQLAFKGANDGIWDWNVKTDEVFFSQRWKEMLGFAEAEIGNTFSEWSKRVHPDDLALVTQTIQDHFAGKTPFYISEHRILCKDGSYKWILAKGQALWDESNNVIRMAGSHTDITQQHRVWNNLQFQYRQTKLLTEIADKIRMSIDPDEVLQTTVTEVQHLLACDRVLIVEIEANKIALPISEAILEDLTPMLGYELADPLLMGEYLTQYRQGKVLAIDNLATASIAPEIELLLQQFQIQAKLVVPILSQGELKGLLIAHQCHRPRKWQDNEIQLLNRLADCVGVALSQAQLFNYTEKLVLERTKELTTANELLKLEIAERERTEQDLRENQQKLAGILDNADEAIVTIDEQQNIQLFNRGAEEIFGYQAREIIGKPLEILIPQAFRRVHHQHVKNFGQSKEYSRRMAQRHTNVFGLHKDGREFSAEASVAKLQTKSGMLFTVMLKDISERKQTLEKLQASKTLLAKAEKIAKIGSWEYDYETKQKTWSDELFNILGFVKSNPLPNCQEILEHIHPEDRLLVRKTLVTAHQKGQSWELNYRLLLPDGTIKYIESRGEPTVDSQGKVLRVLEIIMDVSDRVVAEKSQQRSEQQLELITDALPVLIAYIDNRQCYRYNNRTYETWFGKSRSSLIGLSIKELMGEENYQRMLPYIEMALTGEETAFETQVATNGNLYWMSATYIPDFATDGKVKGFFSMVEDITERKAVEQMKSEFISIASHEMRTPLTSIHGVIKLLSAERLGKLSERGKVMADMALRNSDRLVHLVSDILDLERMESGRDEITKSNCSSERLIQQAIDTVSSMAQSQQVTLEADAGSIEFLGDRDRLTQALINLISNAVKFSPANSKVTVTASDRDDRVLFSVVDRGRGIPADKLETIFERFQQVDASDSRRKGGTGLGLAICRHIIEQHQGRIWVDSTYGTGSTFFFTVPK